MNAYDLSQLACERRSGVERGAEAGSCQGPLGLSLVSACADVAE